MELTNTSVNFHRKYTEVLVNLHILLIKSYLNQHHTVCLLLDLSFGR